MIYIDKVHYEHCNTILGNNEVITEVKYTDNLYLSASKKCDKSAMINYIQKGNKVKTKYMKHGLWVSGEDVRVVDNCLRTDSNKFKADNLENLPRY